jgi:hypothetical protein
MEDLPIIKRAANRAIGFLYAFLYFTSDQLFLGATLRGWITVLLFLLAPYLWLRSGSLTYFLMALAVLVIVRISYWKAGRDGYIVFVALAGEKVPADVQHAEDMQKYSVKASGIFSVIGREEHMVQRQAILWRVPVGDHAFMVQRPTGRYFYQFIEAGHIKKIRAGWLVFGKQTNAALEIDFKTTWGTDAGESDFSFFSSSDSEGPKRRKRSIYIGFDDQPDRDAIWISLLEKAK